MNYENNSEREQLLACASRACTLPEIEAAAKALRAWIKQHPDDLNIEDALEPLAMLRQALENETVPLIKAS